MVGWNRRTEQPINFSGTEKIQKHLEEQSSKHKVASRSLLATLFLTLAAKKKIDAKEAVEELELMR